MKGKLSETTIKFLRLLEGDNTLRVKPCPPDSGVIIEIDEGYDADMIAKLEGEGFTYEEGVGLHCLVDENALDRALNDDREWHLVTPNGTRLTITK